MQEDNSPKGTTLLREPLLGPPHPVARNCEYLVYKRVQIDTEASV